ncbi:unnamed protein product [Paramecium primaurelia]|uniref:Uncharacterized protein n=1 Tax=Paramecium primaurelia TaxID=5886 RepID=A0A8S1QGP0_PARPR|nr:unnamed protein product [Paramecium primaurelia]
MNFLNKIFASSLNRGSFQIEDVSGSDEDQDEIPEHQVIPQFKKQSIQQLSSYNSRKKPQSKMGQADFLAKYDENFDDVFGDKPPPIDFPKGRKRRQEDDEEDENDNDNERKSQKKKTQSKERKQQSKEQKDQSKEQKDNKKITKEFKETIDYKEFNKEYKESIEPKILKEPKIRLPKFPKQRKRIANNHLSTLRSNSDGRDSVSNKDRESIQLNNKYNPNDIALPQTAIPKSEKKQDKQKTMFFTFGMNDNDDSDSEKDIKNKINDLFDDQKQKIDQNEQQSNNNINNHLKEQEKKKQKNDEKKDRNEKKQRKEKKDNDKKTINHLDIFDEIKDIQKNLNSKQNSEQRETRKLNSEQREKKRDKKRESKQNRDKNQKQTSKSPSPQLKLIQYETQKKVKRSQKRVVQDLEMLNVDELSLNPNIVECKANLYLDYIPVYD